MCTPTAYTVGSTESYEQLINSSTDPKKLGSHPEAHPEYEGGIVFKTIADAKAWLSINPQYAYSIYGLVLPTSWEFDVSPVIDASIGGYRLLHDALIVRV